MNYVRKLPLLIALMSAMIIGLAGRLQRVPDRENMMRMVIVMVIFYSIGLLIRSTVLQIVESFEKKAEEEEKAKKLLENESQMEEMDISKQVENQNGKILDLAADDDLSFGTDDEDFDALPVADFIKKELNQ